MNIYHEQSLSTLDPTLKRIIIEISKSQIKTTNNVFHDLMSKAMVGS